MKFCSLCAQPVAYVTPKGDHLPRYVCGSCGEIHYQNPRIVVGCVPEYDGKILLCRRAIEPRLGYWTLPAGFMENGESMQTGAARESMEEALANVEIGSLLAVIHVLHADQVHVLFRAKLLNLDFGPSPESLEVRLFDEAGIPWQEMAFRSIEFGLRKYLEDRRLGLERHHFHDLDLRNKSIPA